MTRTIYTCDALRLSITCDGSRHHSIMAGRARESWPCTCARDPKAAPEPVDLGEGPASHYGTAGGAWTGD